MRPKAAEESLPMGTLVVLVLHRATGWDVSGLQCIAALLLLQQALGHHDSPLLHCWRHGSAGDDCLHGPNAVLVNDFDDVTRLGYD